MHILCFDSFSELSLTNAEVKNIIPILELISIESTAHLLKIFLQLPRRLYIHETISAKIFLRIK